MKIKHPVKLTVPNKIDYLPIIDKTVSTMARKLGFKKQDIAKIKVGLEEAVVHILETAFSPGEETTFDVILQPQTTGLKIILKEMGMPFDPKSVDEYDPAKLKDTYSEEGLGVFLMQQFVDEVSFLNLGKEGKETHLFKYFNNKSVEEMMSSEELEKAKKAFTEEPLPRNSVEFIIRRIKEKEAVEISKCAYSSYGYSYINEDIYFPDRIWSQNQSGELISLVAVTKDGKIMGHTALEIEERDPLFPQLGMAFVMPRYRGQGCLNQAVPRLIGIANEHGFTGVYGRGITTHPYSQKSLLKFNFSETALLLSSGPGREYRGIVEGLTQRESVMLLSHMLKDVREVNLYAPVKHQPIIGKIYENLGLRARFNTETKNKSALNPQSVITIKTENVNQVAHIFMLEYGTNVIDEVLHNLKSLCLDRFETIYLHLKMNDPHILDFLPEFEKMDFFFAGIMPASSGKEELILQYLNNYRINYENIKVASDMGTELKEYLHNLDPNQKI